MSIETTCFDVSNNPPLLDTIVAHPDAVASNETRPNGSSQREGTTAISDLSNISNVSL